MNRVLILAGIVIVIAGGWYYLSSSREQTDEISITQTREVAPASTKVPEQIPGASIGNENEVHFICAEGKSIIAVFTRDILALTLSDERQITLRESKTEAGMRFLSNTGSVEFRDSGTGASLIESGTVTYANCTAE